MIKRICNCFLKICLIILGTLTTSYMFTDCFNIDCKWLAICGFTALAALIFFAVVGNDKGTIVLVGLAIVLVGIAFVLRDDLKQGFINIFEHIKYQYQMYFNGQSIKSTELAIQNAGRYSNTVAMVFVCIGYVYMLVLATKDELYSQMHIIANLFVTIVVVVLGKMPSLLCVCLMMFYYLICIAYYKEENFVSKKLIYSCVFFSVTIGTLFALNNPKDYEEKDRFEELKTEAEELSNKLQLNTLLSMLFEKKDKASGGINEGKLGDVSEVKYSGDTMLNVSMVGSYKDTYLIGFIGTSYENGNQWKRASEKTLHEYRKFWMNRDYVVEDKADDLASGYTEKEFVKNGFDIQNRGYYYSRLYKGCEDKKLFLEYVDEEKSVYPYNAYFGDYLEFDGYETEDGIAAGHLGKEANELEDYYIMSEYDYADIIRDNDAYEGDADYRNFVYESYTDVPENLKNLFFRIMPDMPKYCEDVTNWKVGGFDAGRLDECVSYVVRYLAENTEYTLNPGKLGKGKDFIQDFLVNTKKGYCTYYASAAVMMFRYMGIPARYVEGYKLSAEEKMGNIPADNAEKKVGRFETYEVKDSDAHAWAEIYVDGIGFVPIEVTATTERQGQAQNQETTINPNEGSNDLETTSPNETTNEFETTDSQDSTNKEETTNPDGDDETTNPDEMKDGNEQTNVIIDEGNQSTTRPDDENQRGEAGKNENQNNEEKPEDKNPEDEKQENEKSEDEKSEEDSKTEGYLYLIVAGVIILLILLFIVLRIILHKKNVNGFNKLYESEEDENTKKILYELGELFKLLEDKGIYRDEVIYRDKFINAIENAEAKNEEEIPREDTIRMAEIICHIKYAEERAVYDEKDVQLVTNYVEKCKKCLQ